MRKPLSGIWILALLFVIGNSATRYISPTGSDAAAGTQNAPWGTFDHAVAQLYPGDVLVVMDGTYDGTNSGYIWIENVNGTVSNPVTIRAQNERKAWIKGDGYIPVYVKTSSYVNVEGLRISNLDLAANPTANVFVYRSNNITLKRSLLTHSNRLVNNALLQLIESKKLLIEENEFYCWTGLGINFSSDDSVEIRRNYFNRRGYEVLNVSFAQEAGIQVYPGENSHNIIENNISENTELGFTEQTIGPSSHNLFLGNIAMGGAEGTMGIVIKARDQYGSPPAYSPTDDTVKDFVSVGVSNGFIGRGGNRTTIINSSFLDNAAGGVGSDVESGIFEEGITVSVFGRNILVTGGQYSGFGIKQQQAWGFDYTNAYGSVLNYNPENDPHFTHATQVNPAMGTCKVWIPANSPMKGAGKNGEDIGANILYRYESGVLTNQPLWDPVTGEFPHGAIVPGVNDIAGQSAFDVHTRLNVNCNSCPFPAGYANTKITERIEVDAGRKAITLRATPAGIAIQWNGNAGAKATIYSLRGEKVGSIGNVGSQSVWYPGKSAAGVYLVKVESGSVVQTARVLCVR